MKIKKTFRLSEDIVELMDHRDQRKYPSREFYLESAVRKFAENPDDKTDEKLESILSAVHKNEQLGMEILSQLQREKRRNMYKRSMRSLIWILLIICCNRRNEMDFEKWHDQVKKTMANRLKESWLM